MAAESVAQEGKVTEGERARATCKSFCRAGRTAPRLIRTDALVVYFQKVRTPSERGERGARDE